MQEAEVQDVLGLDEVKEADPILVKGWAASLLYPDPGMRLYSDIDLLIVPERYELLNDGLRTRQKTNRGWLTAVDVQEKWKDMPDRTWDELHAHSRLVRLRDRRVRVLGSEDSLRLSCLHFLRHAGSKPVWLCDIAALMEKLPSGFDWDYCFKGRHRQADWIISVIQFASELLGARIPTAVRDRVAAPTPRWMIKAVLGRWGDLATYTGERRVPLSTVLKANLRALPRAAIRRWPSPVESVCLLSWPIRTYSGLAAQAIVYSARAATWPLRQGAISWPRQPVLTKWLNRY